jgi:uncharacterized membrane protein HdeD (DUF308 family)
MTANDLLDQVATDIWWFALLRGIAAVLLGLLLFTNTAATIEVIFIFLGIYWLMDGIVTLLASFTGRKEHEGWGWGVFFRCYKHPCRPGGSVTAGTRRDIHS